ncbi:MAG: tryptophan 2,3-dioxygenase [Mycobacteriales bacterium]|nr:tryptophan 2,3-dioxygenase [Frankia sp.]
MTSGRSFGEEGGRLSYNGYLRVPELLAQQVPQSDPLAHDELLFITVHQVYELWFKELLHELEAARDAMLAGDAYTPRHLLQRCHVIERVLIEQVAVLETMTPQDFLAFRSLLAPASGFQSVQFRELEFLSGAGDPGFVDRLRDIGEDERARLKRRLAEPTLWGAFCALLEARGLPMGDELARRESLLTVARNRTPYGDLWDVSEALVTHDEMAVQWRMRHVDMAERQIGTKSGTAGSSGGPYLRSRLAMRYYPELWELRTYL